uniref:proton-coupled folate transporter-like isoform X3 n=1 Tax=Styela clava TaxID=7725 RepID=UPI001939D0EC|nr:proton-coupled folate transporter-like isoform X3 [Styela clava]
MAKLRCPHVELLVFFVCCTIYSSDTILNEFIYQVVSERNNFTTDHTLNYCADNFKQSEVRRIVAEETSRWGMYERVAQRISNVVAALVITSASDQIGRKKALLFPVLGTVISSTLQTCIIKFKLTILEVFSHFGGGISLLGTGFWIKYQGFVPPSLFLVSCSCVGLVLLAFLPSKNIVSRYQENEDSVNLITTDRKEEPELNSTTKTNLGIWIQAKIFWEICSSDKSVCHICIQGNTKLCSHAGNIHKGRVWRLWFYIIAYALYMFVVNGIELFQTMFFISRPICFTPELVGAQNSLDASSIIFSIFLVIFYENVLHMESQAILLTAMFARFTTSLLMFCSSEATLIFIATSIGPFSNITSPYLRRGISSLVSSFEQGSVFALLSFVNGIIGIFTPIVVLTLYPATLAISYSFIWIVMASILCFPLILMTIVWIADRKRTDK